MAESAAGSKRHMHEPSCGRSDIEAVKRCFILFPKMFEETFEVSVLVIFHPGIVLLLFVTFTTPPTRSHQTCISDPVTPPTYISCSTPAATIITDMLSAWSLTPSATVAVVFSQLARLANGLLLAWSLYYPLIVYFPLSDLLHSFFNGSWGFSLF